MSSLKSVNVAGHDNVGCGIRGSVGWQDNRVRHGTGSSRAHYGISGLNGPRWQSRMSTGTMQGKRSGFVPRELDCQKSLAARPRGETGST